MPGDHVAVLRHHDLCFGCGQGNLFGLQMQLERRDDGTVSGRCFLKQDHQGPDGNAHGGVLAAALQEAISHAAGEAPPRIEVELLASAPVGVFIDLQADRCEATARLDGEVVARGRALNAKAG